MSRKNKFVRFTIIFILVFFVAVTWLSMIVPYIGGNKNTANGTGEVDTWMIVESDAADVEVETWTSTLPEMTKEEASQKIQQLLSGIDTAETTK